MNTEQNHLLIVDDEPKILNSLLRALRGENYQIHVASTREEAEEIFEKVAPQVIMVDQRMPGFTGVELLSKFKEKNPNNIRIILTAYMDFDVAIDAINRGEVYKYICKPWDDKELRDLINHAFRTQVSKQNIDSETGLPNRASFVSQVGEKLKASVQGKDFYALFVCEKNHLKDYLAALGSSQAQVFLNEIVMRLKNHLDEGDLLGRISETEFAVLLHENAEFTKSERLEAQAGLDRMQPFLVGGREIYLSCKGGVARFPFDASSANDLLTCADYALEYARQTETNSLVLFNSEIKQYVHEQMRVENDLYNALEKGQYELYFQPKVSLADEKCYSIEALIRWNHPERGVISPDEFIPVAESIGLIIDIGQWVLNEACDYLKKLHALGYSNLTMAVNLSPKQLMWAELGKTARDLLAQKKLDTRYLEFEVTESCLMTNYQNGIKALKELRKMGFSLAMDDFGTGYSSLALLMDLPFNTIKIDRKFIASMFLSDQNLNLIDSIIYIAKKNNFVLVAEGIESQEQEHHLKLAGCSFGQGNYYAKAMSFEELKDYLKKNLSEAL